MPVSKKTSLELKFDATSNLGTFIEWYEDAYRTTNEDTGRKRKGNAKQTILSFLQFSLSKLDATDKEYLSQYQDIIKRFREDTKLPVELQKAKNNLSEEEYETFKSLYEKSALEASKNE